MAIGAAPARAADQIPVVVVSDLTLDDVERLAQRGAVGLLIPGAGPTTSEELAQAALARGTLRNSLLGGLPSGPALISVERAAKAPASGPAIVVALPTGGEQKNDRRYPIVVLGEGYEGLLTSEATRLPGLVSIDEIAPTALGREGALGSQPEDDPAAALRDLDRRLEENAVSRTPALLLEVALIAALALVLPQAAVLAFGTALAANLILGVAGISTPWLVLTVIGVAVAAGAPLLALLLRSNLAVGLALVAAVAGYLAAMALDSSAVGLSPQNTRPYGLSNLLETLLLVPALAGTALLSARFGGLGFVVAAGLAVVTVAGNRFGADGGGAVVLGVAYAVLGVGLMGLRWRVLAVALPAAAVLVLALEGIDAATGGSSHVTRALGEGPEKVVSDLARRLTISYERTVSDWPVALVVIAAALALIVLVGRMPRLALAPGQRALLLAFAAAVGVSLLINDSPHNVLVAGLVGYFALERYERGQRPSSPRSAARRRAPGPSATARTKRPGRLAWSRVIPSGERATQT